MKYNGHYNKVISVTVVWEDDSLMAYVDGDMEDGFAYEVYEDRLRKGDAFFDVAAEIVDALDSRDSY